MKISVADLYKYSKLQNVPLLGSANYDFWAPYTSGFANFDRYFRNRFKSWLYFESFASGQAVEDMHTDFTETIAAHLAINSKRYSELYRVQILANDAYDIVNNYDLNETHTNTHSESGENVSGSRTDSTTNNNGAQTTTNTGSVQGFNSAAFSDSDKQVIASASYTDSASLSKGSQTDTHSASGTENITIRRYGNIGVQTPADVIGGHIELWQDLFNFYKLIFDEIAKEYLLLTDGYEEETSGGGSASEDLIMRELAEIKAQITASTAAIRGDISTSTGAIREDVADVHSAVSVVDGKTDDIIESIEGVATNEY
jgi:hypothetical protein